MSIKDNILTDTTRITEFDAWDALNYGVRSELIDEEFLKQIKDSKAWYAEKEANPNILMHPDGRPMMDTPICDANEIQAGDEAHYLSIRHAHELERKLRLAELQRAGAQQELERLWKIEECARNLDPHGMNSFAALQKALETKGPE